MRCDMSLEGVFNSFNVALLCAVAALSACGGGGGGGTLPPNVPTIIIQPMSTTAAQGGTASFTVGVSGNGTVSYQWRQNGTPVGTNSATLSLTNIQPTAAGSYDCVITNTIGSASTMATSATVTLTVAHLPNITTQPEAATVGLGTTATFAVVGTANGTLSYQWTQNGTALNGETSATLTLANVQVSQDGAYACTVTNTLNGVAVSSASTAATLTVVAPPGVPLVSAPTAVVAGSMGNIASVAAQTGVTYAWTVANGTVTSGQGTAQITFTASALGPVTVNVTLTNIGGSVSNVGSVLSVNSLPITSVFSQNPVLPETSNILASTPGATGQSYAWTVVNGTATGTVSGTSNAQTLNYGVGAVAGSYQLAVRVQDSSGRIGSSTQTLQVVSNTFIKDPSDLGERTAQTSALLNDGRVLITGGTDADGGALASTVEYDPTTNVWATVGAMATARTGHTMTLLNNGWVLVTGGGGALASAEIYNPATLSWTPAGTMAAARTGHTASLLADGRVLVAGGYGSAGTPIATAEIYDPASNLWSLASSMNTARSLQNAVTLADGRVLVAGGDVVGDDTATTSAEIYDPSTNTWSPAASMATARMVFGSVLLPSGKALVLGFEGELYDPIANTWTSSNGQPDINIPGVGYPVAILLRNGNVLATGGLIINVGAHPSTAVQIYNPVTNSWGATQSLAESRGAATGNLLASGKILVAGGSSPCGALGDAELFDPVSGTSTIIGTQSGGGGFSKISVLNDGRLLATGGEQICSGTLQASPGSFVFDPTANSWSLVGTMSQARYAHTESVLQSGLVLVAGGEAAGPIVDTAELFSPTTQQWTAAGSMPAAVWQHTASVLPNGQVLIAGGNVGGQTNEPNVSTNAAQLYDPGSATWSQTGALTTGRYNHTATLLANGTVLVAGGTTAGALTGQTVLATAELYNPSTGTWTSAGTMNAARSSHTATLLPSGMVLVAGGDSSGVSAELYDPVANTWTLAAPMTAARSMAASTPLSNGNVLIVGGEDSSTAEEYDPSTNSWTSAGTLAFSQAAVVIASLSDGRVVAYGGDGAAPTPQYYK
jgi:N-acetylneuraminic acid mutarotase